MGFPGNLIFEVDLNDMCLRLLGLNLCLLCIAYICCSKFNVILLLHSCIAFNPMLYYELHFSVLC